jgi:hypothetical protein
MKLYKNIRTLTVFIILIFGSGCAEFAGIKDYTSVLENLAEPNVNNNYVGQLFVDPITGNDITDSYIKQRAYQICSTRGGIKIEPYMTLKGPIHATAGRYQFQCNGFQQNAIPVPDSRIIPEKFNAPISIEEARQKCKDLGFKERTEKFGTCVLELTK